MRMYATFFPRKVMTPVNLRSKLPRMFSSVVLPEPFSPRMPTKLPAGNCPVAPASTCFLP